MTTIVDCEHKVLMENCVKLFNECPWQVDLHLQDKLIEYNHQFIRVTPAYNSEKPPADALLVTSEAMTHEEFVFWHRILEILGVSADIWDTVACLLIAVRVYNTGTLGMGVILEK